MRRPLRAHPPARGPQDAGGVRHNAGGCIRGRQGARAILLRSCSPQFLTHPFSASAHHCLPPPAPCPVLTVREHVGGRRERLRVGHTCTRRGWGRFKGGLGGPCRTRRACGLHLPHGAGPLCWLNPQAAPPEMVLDTLPPRKMAPQVSITAAICGGPGAKRDTGHARTWACAGGGGGGGRWQGTGAPFQRRQLLLRLRAGAGRPVSRCFPGGLHDSPPPPSTSSGCGSPQKWQRRWPHRWRRYRRP